MSNPMQVCLSKICWKAAVIAFGLMPTVITAQSARAQTFNTLHSLTGFPADGAYSNAGLVQGTDGNFYGTTVEGGTDDSGTVFEITRSGAVTILHSFAVTDGQSPWAGLIQALDGNFYGTTLVDGVFYGYGAIFKISPDGALTTLYSFAGADGQWPYGGLVQATDGNFYGMTAYGGAYSSGTVFKLTPGGTATARSSRSPPEAL